MEMNIGAIFDWDRVIQIFPPIMRKVGIDLLKRTAEASLLIILKRALG